MLTEPVRRGWFCPENSSAALAHFLFLTFQRKEFGMRLEIHFAALLARAEPTTEPEMLFRNISLKSFF